MRLRPILLALLCASLLPACASLPPGERDPRDPYERFNRSIYRFNDTLDRSVAKPVARAYTKIAPAPVRTGVSNFFRNVNSVTVMVNNLLQLKPKAFFAETARLMVNTTLGIGGLFDPASQMGLPAGDEDFGQTLGRWGVKSGPYLVLPVLGPSSARDSFGLVGDQFTDPKYYLVEEFWVRAGLTVGSLIDTRASLLGTDDVLASSFDPYVFMRNAFLQRREFLVRDGKVPAQEEFEIFEFEEDEATGDDAAGDDAPAPTDGAAPTATEPATAAPVPQ
jgi:phospholipid-binding lipoprotein MlaA